MCVFEHHFKTKDAKDCCECRTVMLTLFFFKLENERKLVNGVKEDNSLLFLYLPP